MKTNFRSMALAALVLLGLGACSNELDEQFQQTEGQELTFNLSINGLTRTFTDVNRATTFVNGDAVGLFAFEKGTQNLAYTNVKLTYNGTTWTADSKVFSDKAYDFYAYYPYNANVTSPNAIAVSAQADQTSGYNLSDVLASTKSEVAAEATEVPLTFNHVFSMVEVQVSGDLVTVKPSGDITLDNVQTTAALDLTTGKATANGNKASVKAFYLGEKEGVHAYRAIIPSQTVANGIQLLTVNGVGDKSYAMKHPSDVVYTAGKYRQLKMNIGKEKVELTIPTPTINPWEADTEIPGQGEEVTPPAPELEVITVFEVPLSTYSEPNNLTAGAKNDGTGALTSTKDEWFHRENNVSNVQTTVAVSGNKLQLTNAADKRGAWNNSGVMFHKSGKFERTTYKVTITASSSVENGSVGITVSNSNDTKRFKFFTEKGTDWSRNVTTFANLNTTSVTKSFYIDCAHASKEGKSSQLTAYDATTDADVATGIFVTLYNYTSNASENTVIVESVKIEKAELPAQ